MLDRFQKYEKRYLTDVCLVNIGSMLFNRLLVYKYFWIFIFLIFRVNYLFFAILGFFISELRNNMKYKNCIPSDPFNLLIIKITRKYQQFCVCVCPEFVIYTTFSLSVSSSVRNFPFDFFALEYNEDELCLFWKY